MPVISPVYCHELSEETFRSKAAAARDHARILREKDETTKRKDQRSALDNYVRLNATSPSHLITLMTDMLAEHAKVKLDIRFERLTFGLVETMHSHPIDKSCTGWGCNGKDPHVKELGWYGHVSGRMTPLPGFKGKTIPWGFLSLCGDSFFERPPIRFSGVNTGSGSGGDSFGYELRLFIDDFPLIKAKYERLKVMRSEQTARALVTNENRDAALARVKAAHEGAARLAAQAHHIKQATDLRAKASDHDIKARYEMDRFTDLVEGDAARTLPAWDRKVDEAETTDLKDLFGAFSP